MNDVLVYFVRHSHTKCTRSFQRVFSGSSLRISYFRNSRSWLNYSGTSRERMDECPLSVLILKATVTRCKGEHGRIV